MRCLYRRAVVDGLIREPNNPAAKVAKPRRLASTRQALALGLRPRDLDPEQRLIFLRGKGGTSRWQPVSPMLMRHLVEHHTERGGGVRDGPLLRYRNGRPLTYRHPRCAGSARWPGRDRAG
jgi:integrase